MPVSEETFTHKFGGWREAEARRWKNPDGSEGGIVAVSASVHPSVTLPASVEVWPDAKIAEWAGRIGDGASIGYGASIGPRASIGYGAVYEDGDWLFVAGPQGSRNAYATAVDSPKYGLRWWVGCQHGITTERFRERVEYEHGATDYGDDYRALIDFVERHPGRLRAVAARQIAPAQAAE